MRACLVAKSHLTLCDPMDGSLPNTSLQGIFQARILEWVAFPCSRDLPKSGIKSMSPVSPALAGKFFSTEPLGKPQVASMSWLL